MTLKVHMTCKEMTLKVHDCKDSNVGFDTILGAVKGMDFSLLGSNCKWYVNTTPCNKPCAQPRCKALGGAKCFGNICRRGPHPSFCHGKDNLTPCDKNCKDKGCKGHPIEGGAKCWKNKCARGPYRDGNGKIQDELIQFQIIYGN